MRLHYVFIVTYDIYRNVHKMYMYGLNNNHKENLHKIQVKNKMFSTTITIKTNKEDFLGGPVAKTKTALPMQVLIRELKFRMRHNLCSRKKDTEYYYHFRNFPHAPS